VDGDGFDAVACGGDDCMDSVDDPVPAMEGDCEGPGFTPSPDDVYPGAPDDPYDGVDSDCSGTTDFDADGDGWGSCEECDDTNPAIYPNNEAEVWYNGVDEDCDGNDGDQDGDGYVVEGYAWAVGEGQLTGDCWDDPTSRPADFSAGNGFADPDATAVHPGAEEVWYDLVDEDCAGDSDLDQDGDGANTLFYADAGGVIGDDCDDENPAIGPFADEVWYDGVDENCDGADDYDQDGDGERATAFGGTDCDDVDPAVNAAATEDCATVYDDDCDGDTNDDGAIGCATLYADADDDGYGAGAAVCLCSAAGDYTASVDGDCDDSDATVSPAGTEDCATAADDDCDGDPNEFDALNCSNWYLDSDGDGYGTSAYVCACNGTSLFSASNASDCDDSDASVGVDRTWYLDYDGDGYGDAATTLAQCGQPSGYVASSTDCNDYDAAVHPGASETCATAADDDCDGDNNEEGAEGCTSWWADLDGDGYAGTEACFCIPSGAWVYSYADDCDDGSAAAYPGGAEICMDGADGGCDGTPSGCALSGSMSLSLAPWSWWGSAGAGLGEVLASAGDEDRDGLVDVVVALPAAGAGQVWRLGDDGGLVGDDAAWTASGSTTGDRFGSALAGLGDADGDGYPDLLVGADAANGSGVAYLWAGPLSGSSAIAALSGLATADALGAAVSPLGDPDGDGLRGMAIGAPGDDTGGAEAGGVWLLDSMGAWGSVGIASVYDALLYGEAAGDAAGTALAGGSDVDGDGIDDLLVGAPGADDASADEGAVYLVLGPVSGVESLAAAETRIAGGTSGLSLGTGALAMGDVDGDGVHDILIGVPGDDDGGSDAGAVRVVPGSVRGDVPVSGWTTSMLGGAAGDRLGAALAFGDADGAGSSDLLVGAPGYDGAVGTDSGAVFAFVGPFSGALLATDADARFDAETAGDGVGSGVLLPGDIDGDGYGDIVIGASSADSGNGAVYRLRGGGY
jgi:hypothetical protein